MFCLFEERRGTMWITILLGTLVWFSKSQALDDCVNVAAECQGSGSPWTSCYEDRIATCTIKGRVNRDFRRRWVNFSQKADESPTSHHRVRIPSSALQRSRGAAHDKEVLLVTTVLNSTFFKLSPPQPKRKGRRVLPSQPIHRNGTVLGGLVLFVRVGNSPVTNLPQPVELTFKHDQQHAEGTCVFWEVFELENGTGYWSTDGCETHNNGTEFICSCDHLSFFAVLVNPSISVDKANAVALTYITYIGSALSVVFTIISLIIYTCLQRRRPEKAISVHTQLTVALLCLHLSFLPCSLWVGQLKENEDDWVCLGLGLFLHWSMLASMSWMALEGFHLYLLLVRVFNIYVRRYLLKLSLVGWGLPTLTVVVCGILGVYGKYSLPVRDDSNLNSTVQMCWMRTDFPHRLLVSYITTVGFPGLVILCNSCMLGVVVYKLWGLRRGSGSIKSSSSWKMDKENKTMILKDCTTVLGLSCVLGLTWGLGTTTYISVPGLYLFTILNSLQGIFIFLWSVALTCKSQSDNNSSVRDPSSQKMMTTSFNN